MLSRDICLSSPWGQRAKELLANPLCPILLLATFTGVGHWLLLADWNPLLSADTHYYYAPSLEILNQQGRGFRELFVKPFFRAALDTVPRAEESKPIFVCALRLWHMGWKCWLQPGLVLPDPRAYAAFVVAGCVLAFVCLCLLGWKLGHPRIGMATAVAVFWGPWGLSACYFTTYTAFSLALFCGAIFLLLCRPLAASLAAGLLVAFCLLSNQSFFACVPALPLFILLRNAKEGRWRAGKILTVFVLGMILPFAVGEILGEAEWVKVLFPDASIQKPFTILKLYLVRTRTERLEYLPAYRHSFFLTLSCFNSKTLTAAGAAILSIFSVAVLRWLWNGKVAGLTRKLAAPAIQNGLLILLPALTALLVIDGKTAIKVSRCYFLAWPFLVMGLLHLSLGLVQSLPGRLVRVGIACLMLLVSVEDFLRVRDFYQVFQGVPHALQSLARHKVPVVALRQDIYAPFFANMASIGSLDAGQPIPEGEGYLVTGPLVPGALEHSAEQMDLFGYVVRNAPRLALVGEIPFFALYPFLVYEDPAATFGIEVQHQFDRRTYREGLGTVKIWRVSASPSCLHLPFP